MLTSLGAPVTPNNVRNLDAWQRAEGGSTANPDSYNPFNTTKPYGGSHGTNSVGVQAFPDWASGLHATVSTIEQQNMAPILAALRGDVALPQFATAVGVAPWNTDPGMSDARRIAASGGATVDLTGAQNISVRVPGTNIKIPTSPGEALTQGPGLIGDAVGKLGGNVLSDFVKNIAQSGLVMRGTLIVVGLIILFIGLSQVTKSDTAGGTVGSGVGEVRVRVVDAGHKASRGAQGAGEAAAAA